MMDFKTKRFYRLFSFFMVALLAMTMLPARIRAESPAKAKIILTFDDGWLDTHEYALPVLQKAGFPATIYVVRDIANGIQPDMMRPSQIKDLYDAGWDISNHTINHMAYDDGQTDLVDVTDDLVDLEEIYLENQNWIINNFGARGAFHVAYPSGLYSEELINEVLIKIGAKTGRLAETEGMVTAPLHDTLDYYTLPVLPLESESNGVDRAKTEINNAISQGATIIFMLHRVLPQQAELALTVEDLQEFVDFLTEKQDQLDVLTLSEWYDNHAASAATPGPPSAVSMDDDANTVTGMHAGLEYNLDGAGYKAYSAAAFNKLDLSSYHFLLVRQAATGNTPAGLPATFIFTPSPGEARIIFAFHHANKSIKDYALPVLNQQGLVGTSYVSRDIVLWPEEEKRDQILDLDDLADLYAAGWDLGNRTYNGSDIADQLSEVLASLFGENQSWLAENNWTRGLAGASYSGSAGSQLFSAFDQSNIENAIYVSDSNQGTFKAPKNTDLDRYRIKSTTIYNDHLFYMNKAKAAIDEAVHRGHTVIISIYDVQPGVSGQGMILSQAGLEEIAAYARGKINQGLLQNNTISQLIEEAEKRAILYARNGGIGSMLANIAPVFASVRLRAVNFVKEGSEFSGWNTKEDGSGTSYSDQEEINMPEDGLTLYAQWTAKEMHTVSFATDGASPIADLIVEHGSLLVQPDPPQKEAYDFAGWYQDPDLSTAWNFASDQVTADLTLYAKWQIKIHTVSFLDWDETILQSGQLEHGSAATAPPDPQRVGYEFAGWDQDFSLISSDLEIRATYSQIPLPAEFTVTFVSNGGSLIGDLAVAEGSLLPEPAAPSRTGHDFSGWFKDEELTQAWDFDQDTVSDNLVLYAAWSIRSYLVTFIDHDSAIIKQEEIEHGQAATAPPDPQRDGYNFLGWDQDFSSITGPTDINALYELIPEPETFTVTFAGNGGNQPDPVVVNAGGLITEPDQPEKEGYNFTGWYLDENLTSLWDFGQDQVNSDLTLYAKWNIKQFNVVFSDWNNIVLWMETVDYRQSATPPADPQREGYIFTGWDKSFSDIKEDTNLTALYQEKPAEFYTVSFASNGGSQLADARVQEQMLLPEPAPPQKAGHSFAGWYKDEGLTQAWDFGIDRVTGNLTLYAGWTQDSYTVIFFDQAAGEYSRVTVPFNSKISKPTDPQKTGHTFTGWYQAGRAWDFANDKVTGNISLQAAWQPILYTVSFNDWNGRVLKTEQVAYNKPATAPADPQRAGYSFTGWNKDFSKITATTSVTALYRENPAVLYKVSFVSNGGSSLPIVTVPAGQKLARPTDPVRTGYSFAGWYKNKNLTTAWQFSADLVTSDLTLYAAWSARTYQVIFKDWDGRTLKTEQVAHGKSATAPAKPTRSGYAFNGWDKSLANIRQNTTINAVYRQNTITSKQIRINRSAAFLGPVSSGISINQLKSRLDNEPASLKVTDRSGQNLTNPAAVLASGMKIMIDNEPGSQLDIIVLGDINGDSRITVLDMLMLKKHLLGQISLDKTGYQAALLAEGGKPSVLGLLRLKKHLLGQLAITVN